MMALAVAGAASFLTPVATPANTMVLEPGGYRFGDYWKLGLPLLLLFLAVAVFWVPARVAVLWRAPRFRRGRMPAMQARTLRVLHRWFEPSGGVSRRLHS